MQKNAVGLLTITRASREALTKHGLREINRQQETKQKNERSLSLGSKGMLGRYLFPKVGIFPSCKEMWGKFLLRSSAVLLLPLPSGKKLPSRNC